MKPRAIEHFYDDKYRAYQHPEPETWLEKLYLLLKKYELHRNQAAIDLLKPAKRFLDVGAGYGHLIQLAHQHGFQELYGIDISPVVVKHCQVALKQRAVKANVTCQNVDVGTTFKPNYFDAITMVAVFEHIFSPHDVLTELHRILKKGGQLVIEVPNVVFMPRRLSFLFGKLPKTSDEPIYSDGHLQFFTQASLVQLLEQHGFRVEFRGSSGIFSKWRDFWPQLLAANIVVKAIKV